jgi:hypothetical protein
MKHEGDMEAFDFYEHLMNISGPISYAMDEKLTETTPFVQRWKARMVAFKLGDELP